MDNNLFTPVRFDKNGDGWVVELVNNKNKLHFYLDVLIDNGKSVCEWNNFIMNKINSDDQIKIEIDTMRNHFRQAKSAAEKYLSDNNLIKYNIHRHKWNVVN